MVQQGRSLLSSSGDALRLGLLVALAAVISLCLRVSVARAASVSRLSPACVRVLPRGRLVLVLPPRAECPESPVMPRSEGGEPRQLSLVRGVLLY